MKKIAQYILARLKERSTWLGLISCITALGLILTPEQQEQIIAAGMAIAGFVGAFTRDSE